MEVIRSHAAGTRWPQQTIHYELLRTKLWDAWSSRISQKVADIHSWSLG